MGNNRNTRLMLIVIVVLGMMSCSVKRQQVKVIDADVFFNGGNLTEISGKISNMKKGKYVGGMRWSHYDNVITREGLRRFFEIDSLDRFRNWIYLPSPRIVIMTGNSGNPLPIYLEPGSDLTVTADDMMTDVVFSGKLGRINNELNNAPRFDFPNKWDTILREDSTITPALALKMYDTAEADWLLKLDKYMSEQKLSTVAHKILSSMPSYTKATWIMNNEEWLGLDTVEDYAPLADCMNHDIYSLAQMWPGGLTACVTASRLGSRLASRLPKVNASDYPTSVSLFMRRYEAMARFLGFENLPTLLQLAVARTLCRNDVLDRCRDYNEAVATATKTCDLYITNPSIRNEVMKYIDRRYKRYKWRPDQSSPEGKLLSQIIEPAKGKYVILDMWNYMCYPCLKEIKETRAWRESMREKGDTAVVYITPSSSTTPRQYQKMLDTTLAGDITYHLSDDEFNMISAMFNQVLFPYHVLIGPDGTILEEDYRLDPSIKEKD